MFNISLRLVLPVVLVLCALALAARCNQANDPLTSVEAVIMAPLHRSVARRQSLYIDVDIVMHGGLADVHGSLYIDGKMVAYLDTFPVRDATPPLYFCNVLHRYGRLLEMSAMVLTTLLLPQLGLKTKCFTKFLMKCRLL
jgi:hypothetical protein